MALPTGQSGSPKRKPPGLKAIETHYNGYRFRSRLEARWAVFLDHLSIPYEYEAEGYELPDGTRYLPDFYLPEMGIHLEIKGTRPERDDPGFRRWETFADTISNGDCLYPPKAVIAWGSLPNPAEVGILGPANYHEGIYDPVPFGMACCFLNYTWVWVACEACGHPKLVTSYDVAKESNCTRCAKGHTFHADSRRILQAYARARSARFEYGQTPRP